MREIVIGGKYRHFKGHEYRVICVAKDSENLEDMVVYHNEVDDLYWVRPKSEFLSKVDKEKYPDVKQEYRFEEMNIESVNKK